MRGIPSFVTALLLCAPQLQAQSYTTFVPGLGESQLVWTRLNSIGQLQQQVLLPTPKQPTISTTLAVDIQSTQLRNHMAGHPGQHVLIGHSMGGVVLRNAFFDNQSQVWGMLTVATPHNGALVADNGEQLQSYAVSVLNAVRSPVVTVGSAFGMIDTLRRAIENEFNNVEVMLTQRMPINTGAANDAKTSSTAIANNRDRLDNIPHATVYGTIPKGNAWLKVTVGATYGNTDRYADASRALLVGKGVLKSCANVRKYVILYWWSLAKKCARGYNALNTFDDGWARYTANRAPSDGWIVNTSSAYPGTTLSNGSINRQVNGVDHNSLIGVPLGINAMGAQLRDRLGLANP
jgi:predicted alpha/beta hydrolase family esterase